MAITLSGLASVFYDGTAGTEFELWPGGFERVMPGAFDRTLRDRPDVLALYSHDAGRPLARTTSKPPSLTLSVEQRGLRSRIMPDPETPDGAAVLSHVRNQVVRGMSFGFVVIDDKIYRDGKREIRLLHDVELLEISPVAFPAYSGTEIVVESGSRSLFHKLAAYSQRAASVTEATSKRNGKPMIVEHSNARRGFMRASIIEQSAHTLRNKRAALITENETADSARSNEIRGELQSLDRRERDLRQVVTR